MRVHTLDLRFKGIASAIAAYVLEGPSGVALVETGPMTTLDAVLSGLGELGLQPGDIRDVLVTHVHLDHSGAAGWWARQGATVHVHHVGARHLIDPSRLLASAQRVYGDEMETLWGTVLAAPPDRVSGVTDGQKIEVGGLSVHVLDMPGHARHHAVYCVDDVAFTGDAAGIHLPGLDLVDLPAPPPEFDRETWYASIDRLESLGPRALYPTHYGIVEDVRVHLTALRMLIAEASGLVRGMLVAGADRDRMLREYGAWSLERMRLAGADGERLRAYEVANPFEMSVDGITRYWTQRGLDRSSAPA